jgi:hypothetical protein
LHRFNSPNNCSNSRTSAAIKDSSLSRPFVVSGFVLMVIGDRYWQLIRINDMISQPCFSIKYRECINLSR